MVNTFAKRRGGTAGNVSYTLGLLTTPQILFSVAGMDFGEYKEAFAKLGIDTRHISINKKIYTATGFAMTDKSNNQIWGFFNGAIADSTKLQLKSVAKKNDFVLIGPQGEGTISMVKQAVTLGVPYLYDPGFTLTNVSDTDLTYGVTHAHSLIGNDYELKLINDRVKDFASLTKEKMVITTLGKDGAKIIVNGKKTVIKPAKPIAVVDPSGAGDAWRGGFLAGWQRGYDLKTCGQMGSIASCYAIEHYGPQEHSYTKQQFAKRYKDTYNETLLI